MPKVAYSEEDRERIRAKLIAVGLTDGRAGNPAYNRRTNL